MKIPIKNLISLFVFALFLIGCPASTVVREGPSRYEPPKEEKPAYNSPKRTANLEEDEFLRLQTGVTQTKEFVLDGYQWDRRTELWKVGFVIGWLWGGENVMRFPFVLFDSENQLSESARLLPKWDRLAEGFSKQAGLELYGIPFIQIIRMIDKVYSDPRVKHWNIGEIMPLVRGRLKEGWTEKDLDEVIAYYIKYNERQKMLYAWGKEESKFPPGSAEIEEIRKKYEKALLAMPRPKMPDVLLLLEAYKYDGEK